MIILTTIIITFVILSTWIKQTIITLEKEYVTEIKDKALLIIKKKKKNK